MITGELELLGFGVGSDDAGTRGRIENLKSKSIPRPLNLTT